MTSLTSLRHTIITGALFALPLVFNFAFNKWGDITLGAILTFGYHEASQWLSNLSAPKTG